MSSKNINQISISDTLLKYRVYSTPKENSWRQQFINYKFSSDSLIDCNEEEQSKFLTRLRDINCLVLNNIRLKTGCVSNFETVYNWIKSEDNHFIPKNNRRVLYSTNSQDRPVGEKSYINWNGFQVIDMDIKDRNLAERLKVDLFNKLKHYSWFMGIVLSSSGKGLHVYTKIQLMEEDSDILKKKLMFKVNFRHKYTFVYLACLSCIKDTIYTKDNVLAWMDISMNKPQQGVFIGYDDKPLFNTSFFDDFIYVCFDNVEDIGHPDIDWITHKDLKQIFKDYETLTDEDQVITTTVDSVGEPSTDIFNRVHYKHDYRWRLANTLVNIFGYEKGYEYLRSICQHSISSYELKSLCKTAKSHNKQVDPLAVNLLNKNHGFKIKLNVENNVNSKDEIIDIIEKTKNPLILKESNNFITFNIRKTEYLGHIKENILKTIKDNNSRITLLEAGAGLGKTEMVKSLIKDGYRVLMIMPFTSTIKSKVEKDGVWDFYYGNKKVRLDKSPGVAMTVDKFAKLEMIDIESAGIDYIFIDESHLLFQSSYRDVMPKVVRKIRNTVIPIILMTGTPSGETVFFENITHIRVRKEETRRKTFNVCLAENKQDLTMHMCRYMARDIYNGKRILFPSNQGNLYKEDILTRVEYILKTEYADTREVTLNYYKKANVGEKFMDDINFRKTINNTDILMCSDYLSVGVDILDRFEFNIYFSDLKMPQEIEQFANRLRNNNLDIYLFVSKRDNEGNPVNIYKYTPLNLAFSKEEQNMIAGLNKLIDINRNIEDIDTKHSIISKLFRDVKYIIYNDIECKYYFDEIALKVCFFEDKYRQFVQQLPIIVKGMICYGYEYSINELGIFEIKSMIDEVGNVEELVEKSKIQLKQNNTKHINELMSMITVDRLNIYSDVMRGKYDIKKGKEWAEDVVDRSMTVKNIEVFEKVVPLFVSMSKLLTIDDIRDVFKFCQREDGSYNFAAIERIKLLINIVYYSKKDRLDVSVADFMDKVYEFIKIKKCHKTEITRFISDIASEFAHKISTDDIKVYLNRDIMEKLRDVYNKLFRCFVYVNRPNGKGEVKLEKCELLWETKDQKDRVDDLNEKSYMLLQFLGL